MFSRRKLSLAVWASLVVVAFAAAFAFHHPAPPPPTFDSVKAELFTRAHAAMAKLDTDSTRKARSEITARTAELGAIEAQYVKVKHAGASDDQLNQLSVLYANTLADVFASIHETTKNLDLNEMEALESLESKLLRMDKNRFLDEGEEILAVFTPFHDYSTPTAKAYEVILPLQAKLLEAAGVSCPSAAHGDPCAPLSPAEQRDVFVKGARVVLDAASKN